MPAPRVLFGRFVGRVTLAAIIAVVAPARADDLAEKNTVPRLSLDEFLRRAQTSSPVIDLARAELAKYEAQFERAYFAWTPTLKIESILAPLPERRLLRRCLSDQIDLDSNLPLITPCPGQAVEDDEALSADTEIGILTRTTAKLTVPIYSFGKFDAAQRAARAGVEAGRRGIEQARDAIAIEVKRAYFGVQLAHSALDVLGEVRKRIRKAKRDIERALDNESGKFTRNDLRKLIVKEAEIEARFLETDALARVAWRLLRLAGGFGRDEKFALDAMDLEPVHIEVRSADAYIELAVLSRPELRMTEASVRAHQGLVDLAVADFFPNIALVGGFGFAKGTTAEDNPDPFANDDYNFLRWGVVLGAEWNLDFADRISKLHEAEAKVAKARAQRNTLRQMIEIEIESHYGQVERYAAEIESRRIAMKAGRGWLVSNSLNFGLGLASTDDLIDSLKSFAEARVNYYQAIYKYNVAVAQLSKTIGVELAVPGPPEYD